MEFKDYKPDSKILNNQDISKKDKENRENFGQGNEGNRKFTDEELELIGYKKKGMGRRRFLEILGGGMATLAGGTAIIKGIEHLTNEDAPQPKSDMSANEQAPEIKIKRSLKKETYEREHMLPEQILKEFGSSRKKYTN